jgi:hypothetical protein
MSESVQFWLDNKMSAGIKMAAIGEQVLVSYRERFYVVEKDAAHTRGGKALRYSNSSLPAIWKRALRGEALPAEALIVPADDALPDSTVSNRERTRKKRTQPATLAPPDVQPPVVDTTVQPSISTSETKPARSVKKMESKPVPQTTVTASCPQCNQRHELPLEKGKNGKPFFTVCTKCKADFAVRFVPVMVYQAQVAGFRPV